MRHVSDTSSQGCYLPFPVAVVVSIPFRPRLFRAKAPEKVVVLVGGVVCRVADWRPEARSRSLYKLGTRSIDLDSLFDAGSFHTADRFFPLPLL